MSCGASVSTRNGSARPSPSARITASASAAGWVRAKPTAVPMNGAVQGVATTAASTPVKNEPASPERRVSPWPRPCSDDPRWNTPERLKPMASSR